MATEKEVNVVEGSDTVIGIEVVNVVRWVLGDVGVALEDIDVPLADCEVREAEGEAEEGGIADVETSVGEVGAEDCEDCEEPVGRYVEVLLVVHQRLWVVLRDMICSLAVRRSRGVERMTRG